jgi:hypothetical protein
MGWMIWGLHTGSGNRFFLSPKWPEWLWNSPSLLLMGVGVISQGKSGWGMRMTTPSCLVQGLRMSGMARQYVYIALEFDIQRTVHFDIFL